MIAVSNVCARRLGIRSLTAPARTGSSDRPLSGSCMQVKKHLTGDDAPETCKDLAYGADDVILRLLGQIRMHWQAEHLGRQQLRDGQSVACDWEMSICSLPVQW